MKDFLSFTSKFGFPKLSQTTSRPSNLNTGFSKRHGANSGKRIYYEDMEENTSLLQQSGAI